MFSLFRMRTTKRSFVPGIHQGREPSQAWQGGSKALEPRNGTHPCEHTRQEQSWLLLPRSPLEEHAVQRLQPWAWAPGPASASFPRRRNKTASGDWNCSFTLRPGPKEEQRGMEGPPLSKAHPNPCPSPGEGGHGRNSTEPGWRG